jgi:hypothetical protein
MLTSTRQAHEIRDDVDQILAQDFGKEHMTSTQCEQLDTMFATLLAAELRVQKSYVRWTASLRRFLTRSAHGRYRRLLSLADRALHTGAAWVEHDPGVRTLDIDILRIGPYAITDISQTQLWRDLGPQQVTVDAAPRAVSLPETDRAALRLAAGTSRRAVSRTINTLLRERPVVTGAEVYDATPAEFQRLGALVTLLDLAITHGQVNVDIGEQVTIARDREQALRVLFPHLVFDRRIDIGESA